MKDVVGLIEIRGIGVSGKKTSGIAYKLVKHFSQYHDSKHKSVEEEKKRFQQILTIAKQQIEELYHKANEIDESSAEIFTSHELLLSDVELIKYVNQLLDYGYDLDSALIRTREDMKTHFLNMKSEIFRSKADDIDDVFERLLQVEAGIAQDDSFPKQPFVLVCDDILPSIIYQIPEGQLKGIITRFGSNCSHGVILARTKNIPVVIRTKNRIDQIKNDDKIIMNGESGAIFILDK